MAHVELSLSDALAPSTGTPQERTTCEPAETDGFRRWVSAVSVAAEPCLLIDNNRVVTAASPSCCQLLCLGSPATVIGSHLLGGGLRLLDFTADRGELTEQDISRIPPLLAISSGRLARGLLRVRCGSTGGTDSTVDAIATPLVVRGAVAGSLTFFAEV